ncbi:MAG: hypothetical protein ONB46_21195 [candidate division KSB1 bacterium]|nr:hypothetical protein [candidate division KSB1 bacterium]MDZ7368439.1 hypothetical protein [candidate division KSB1 bacterium]MDZ7406165.1 hypothetical protein [candidate division KSB1 bacterium]
MQTSTLAEVMRQKNLSKLPVLNYREENGRAVIEVQLRSIKPMPVEPAYDAEKIIAKFRAMQINVGYVTNVTKDIRRERDSSPPRRPRRKTKKG